MRRIAPPRGFDGAVTPGHLLRMEAGRTLSGLRHLLTWREASPWDAFGLLRDGIAAMAACTSVPLRDALPPCRHDDPAESFRGLALLLENVTRGPFPEPAASIPFRPGNGFLCAALPEPRVEGALLLVLQSAEPEASSRAAASWPTRSPICPAPSPKPSRAGRCVKFSPRPAFRVGRIFVILKSIRARNTDGPFCVPGRWRWPSFPDAAARRTGRPRAPSARPPARKTDRLRTRCPGGAGRPSRTRPRSRSQDVFVFCS